jgi:glycine/D-amino acid oxidase-like deaminating enzyme
MRLSAGRSVANGRPAGASGAAGWSGTVRPTGRWAGRREGWGAMQQAGAGGSDLIVIGGGAFGLSTAWEAACRGRRTLLLEQGPLPNPTAASYGASRKIRSVYAEPIYARLAREAMARWREIETATGARLYEAVGGLYYTNLDHQPEFEARERVAREVGSPVDVLDQGELRTRFPWFRRARRGLSEPDAGWLRATACVEALLRLAQQAGAVCWPGQPIAAIEPSGSGYLVRAGRASFRAEQVVLAGGGWSGRLCPELRPLLRQYPQGLLYVHDVPPAFYHPAFVPYCCLDSMHYGFGAEPGVGFKVAQHKLGQPTDDPDFDRASTPPGFKEAAIAFLRDDFGLEAADYRLSWESCMYNMSPSSDLLLDFHPALPGVFLATAGSGHSFKYGSLIGQIVLDRLDGVASDRWEPRFSFQALERAELAQQLR